MDIFREKCIYGYYLILDKATLVQWENDFR